MTDFFQCRLAVATDLPGILALQAANLEAELAADEVRSQGFVTVRHDLPLLQAMNDAGAHAVALAGEQVVGYALVMLREFRHRIPILEPMFAQLDDLALTPEAGDDRDYFIMGQVCVARAFRGTGVFTALYRTLRDGYGERYRVVVTEISGRNTRSLRAHEKVGFRPLRVYQHGSDEDWHLVAWDWR